MIELLITYLNTKLGFTNYFEKQYCLTEYVLRENQKYPALYNTKGQYERVDFDKFDGVSYFAKSGDISFSKNTDNQTGCEILYDVSIPLKLVCFVNRNKLSVDNAYSDDSVAISIISQLSNNNAYLKSQLKAKKIEILADRYKTNKDEILEQEYDNVDFKFRYQYSYISIELSINLLINNACILGECDFDKDILHSFDFCNQAIIDRLNSTQLTCLEDYFGGGGGVVNIKDQDGNIIATPACGTDYIVTVLSGIDEGGASTIYTNSVIEN